MSDSGIRTSHLRCDALPADGRTFRFVPGMRLVKCFDMDPRICPVLLVHAATLSRLMMASVHVDGIQGAVVCSPLDASALKSGNRSSVVGVGCSACPRIHGTGQQSERF